MATAAFLSAAARRCSRSASTIGWREVTDCHSLTIDGYAASRKIPKHWFSRSQLFEAVEHSWRIKYHSNCDGGWRGGGHISLYLELELDSFYGVYRVTDPVDFKFTLLDQAGNPVHSRGVEGHVFSDEWRQQGFKEFIKWRDLAKSGCLNDDTFTVRCNLTVFKDWTGMDDGDTNGSGTAAPAAARVTVPLSDLHEHLNNLLWKKQGTDVIIDVAGETFDAHAWLLMARSPVFEEKLLAIAAIREKLPLGVHRMEIKGVDPKVFKAMLRFMYTDALPEMEEEEAVAMAQGLVAAAHRYKLDRMKLVCEEMLCKRIDVKSVAATLAVTEEHGCSALKAACVEFIARPGNMKAVMETEGFEKTKANCLAVMLDLSLKQLLA